MRERPPGKPAWGWLASRRVIQLDRYTTADLVGDRLELVTAPGWDGWYAAQLGDVRPARPRFRRAGTASVQRQLMFT